MPKTKKFLPASVIALRHYSARTFTADLIAGVTVGLVALPLALAFAISLPSVEIPTVHSGLVLQLLSPALTVAMLGAIESLMSAIVADRMAGTRHNSNVELFAQGVANIVSPLFGGLPATGAIARTATNIRSGARTPVAGVIHSATLRMILLFAAPLAAAVPMAVLAGILMVVCYNMGEWHEVPELWKESWTDRLVWLVTFVLTVVADLTVAVEAGMILAALLFIRRISVTTSVTKVTRDYVEHSRQHVLLMRPDYGPSGISRTRSARPAGPCSCAARRPSPRL